MTQKSKPPFTLKLDRSYYEPLYIEWNNDTYYEEDHIKGILYTKTSPTQVWNKINKKVSSELYENMEDYATLYLTESEELFFIIDSIMKELHNKQSIQYDFCES